MNIHKRLCIMFGSCAVDSSTVSCWVLRINHSASEELEDLSGSGRPTTATRSDLLNCADVIILGDSE